MYGGISHSWRILLSSLKVIFLFFKGLARGLSLDAICALIDAAIIADMTAIISSDPKFLQYRKARKELKDLANLEYLKDLQKLEDLKELKKLQEELELGKKQKELRALQLKDLELYCDRVRNQPGYVE